MLPENIGPAVYCFLVSSVIVALTVWIFTKVTKYNDWQEIKEGNTAAAMVLAGNIFAIGNIMRFAIVSNNNPWDTFKWGIVGVIFLLFVYFIFERLAPHLNVDEEIDEGNTAVAVIIMTLSIAFSFVIGASIS